MKEISEMTADELRLEIARAKGWAIHGEGTDSQMIAPPMSDERRYYTAEWDENGFPDYAPNWPADIAAAWELFIEMCVSNNASIHFDIDYGIFHKNGWTVDAGGRILSEFIATAPLAICRAWLAWKAAK